MHNRTRNVDPAQNLNVKKDVFKLTYTSLSNYLKDTPLLIKNKVHTYSYDAFKTYIKTLYWKKCAIRNCYIYAEKDDFCKYLFCSSIFFQDGHD